VGEGKVKSGLGFNLEVHQMVQASRKSIITRNQKKARQGSALSKERKTKQFSLAFRASCGGTTTKAIPNGKGRWKKWGWIGPGGALSGYLESDS